MGRDGKKSKLEGAESLLARRVPFFSPKLYHYAQGRRNKNLWSPERLLAS